MEFVAVMGVLLLVTGGLFFVVRSLSGEKNG